MRRQSLTVGMVPLLPMVVGQSPIIGAAAGSYQTIYFDTLNPASRSDVLRKVSAYDSGGTYIILTGSWDGSSFTVKSVTGDVSGGPPLTGSGLHTFTGLSLPIAAGDFIGCWGYRSLSSGAAIGVNAATPASGRKQSASSKPTVGMVYSATTTAGILSLGATTEA